MSETVPALQLKSRFRGYYPVVIDVETAGFNSETDALLEIAACLLTMNEQDQLIIAKTLHFQIEPFEGANLETHALKFTGIDPHSALRGAVCETKALNEMFSEIRSYQKQHDCQRSLIVAHNAHFDLNFVMAAAKRIATKHNPFHPFTCFDTATLSALAYGHTVLAKTCCLAGIPFDGSQAHNALYDAQKTATLFCKIVNQWHQMGGWPLVEQQETS